MNVLLTGSTGFVGGFILKRLRQSGHKVHCIVRNGEKLSALTTYQEYVPTYEEIEKPELLSTDQIRLILEQKNINTIIHCASLAREYRLPWDEYYRVNVQWARNLASSFTQANCELSRFIYISTVGVYGTIPSRCPADEDTPYQADGKYHRSKMLAEVELVKLKNNFGLPLIILRPSVMYGDGDYGFIYKVLKFASRGITASNVVNHRIHLLDADLMARTIEQTVTYLNEPGHYIYNVSDSSPIHTRDLIELITADSINRHFEIPSLLLTVLEYATRLDPVLNIKLKLLCDDWYYDVQRIQNDFGFGLTDTLSNLNKYMSWYRGAIHGH